MRRLREHQWRYLVSISKPSPRPTTHGFFSFSFSFHSKTDPNSEEQHQLLIDTISRSLRDGENWDTLSTKFSSVVFSDPLVEKILLRFKQPETAKRALTFFHWSARTRNLRHGISSYAVAIHILVRARLLIDARALIESALINSPSALLDSLLATYEVSSSTPFVFDLLVQEIAKLRYLELGFDVFQKLIDRRFSPSVITLNTLLHFSAKSNRIDLVWRIYELAIDKRSSPNETTIQIMIGALCKEGKLKETVDLLDKIHGKRCSSPPVIVNTSLVFRVLESDRIEEGMSLLKRLLQKNMLIDTIGYSLVVYAKTKQGDSESARKVFDEMLQRGFDANAFVYTAFVKMYLNRGDVKEAEKVMIEMENSGIDPYEESFDALVEGFARFGREEEESLKYCEVMVMRRGLVPSCSAFNEMVKRVRKVENAKRANEILTESLELGFVPDEDTYAHLIQRFVEGDDVEQGLKLFYEMEYRKIVPGFAVFRSIIVGLCSCGRVEDGEKYLRIMKRRLIQPNADVYEALIKAFRKIGDKSNADRVYDEMISNQMSQNRVTVLGSW